MKKIKKTASNPYGLTNKQRLVITDAAKRVRDGGNLELPKSVTKVYNVSSKNSAAVISSNNLSNKNFRNALLEELEEKRVLGKDGIVNQKLAEGLDAEGKDGPDYSTRLRYIQEIHKIAGVYAPQQIEKKSLTLNADISEEELDKRISELREELDD